jgi:hypothetical protein
MNFEKAVLLFSDNDLRVADGRFRLAVELEALVEARSSKKLEEPRANAKEVLKKLEVRRSSKLEARSSREQRADES